MSKELMDVPSFLLALPIGSVFTHGNPNSQPDSWVKIGDDRYRRTYDWIQFRAINFSSWEHVELTEPVPYSISQAEADRREAAERNRHSDRRRAPRS